MRSAQKVFLWIVIVLTGALIGLFAAVTSNDHPAYIAASKESLNAIFTSGFLFCLMGMRALEKLAQQTQNQTPLKVLFGTAILIGIPSSLML